MRFNDYVVIITGAAGRGGGGSGAEIAKQFGIEGANVIILDLDEEGGSITAEEIQKNGGTAHFIRTDVSSEEAVNSAVAQTVEFYGHIDVVINNAFYLNSEGPITSISRRVWDRHFAVNVTGAMMLIKAAIPHMLARPFPSIINVSSTSMITGEDGNMAYACSKAALALMTKYVATQYGKTGLRANTIIPGLILNQATKDAAEQNPALRAYFNVLEDNVLTQRIGEAGDVASVALFLASREAAYITGAEIQVDGGFKAHTQEWSTLRKMGG